VSTVQVTRSRSSRRLRYGHPITRSLPVLPYG